MSPLRLAWLDLTRRPVTTLIALLGIALAVSTSGVLLRLTRLSQERFAQLAHRGDALVGAKQGGLEMILGALGGEGALPDYVPMRLFETLSAEVTSGAATPIKRITPFLYFARVGETRVVGTGQGLLGAEWSDDLGIAFAGADLALEPGQTVQADLWTPKPSVERVPLTIRASLPRTHSAYDRMIFTNLATARAALARAPNLSIWGADVLHYFVIDLKPNGFQPLRDLINGRTVAEAVLVEDQAARLRELTGTGEALGLLVTVLVLALGGLSVAAMLITRFEAMALQLAVLRALGHRRAYIAGWLLWEGFLLGVAAAVIGLLLDAALFPSLRTLLGAALPAPEVASSSIWQSAPVWVTAVVATTASVWIPLVRAYRQDVHSSLRS